MSAYITDLETETITNVYFRKVLFTGIHSQLVVMSIEPDDEIGMEVHPHVDQFIRIESGTGKAIVDGEETDLGDGSAVVIPAGAQHNIVNTSATQALKLYTVYSPPNHPAGTVHQTKADAQAAEEHESH